MQKLYFQFPVTPLNLILSAWQRQATEGCKEHALSENGPQCLGER